MSPRNGEPGDSPFWESERAEIIKWLDIDEQWHEGPPANANQAYDIEHYIIRVPTDEGDRYFTIHYPPTEDFDLDFEVDRIYDEYAGELG